MIVKTEPEPEPEPAPETSAVNFRHSGQSISEDPESSHSCHRACAP